MNGELLSLLRCPVTRSPLQLRTITSQSAPGESVSEGILFAAEDWFYPVIGGIPRLTVEAFIDYAEFLQSHLTDYSARRRALEEKYRRLIAYVQRKNKKTKETFSLEWSLYNYTNDRTWGAEKQHLLPRFLEETGESEEGLSGKMIFDAGCGHGHLDSFIAAQGAKVIAMDLSNSIERAYQQNTTPYAWFIQGDVQFPPVKPNAFDIVHCSGVLHHTNNTELSFSCLEPCVRQGGVYSIWLYHSRKEKLHAVFNFFRGFTRRLPAKTVYFLLNYTLLPVTWAWKTIKGNRQKKREMMIELMDWFSPEFRQEHEPDETAAWYAKRGYHSVTVTTWNSFGFNMTGRKG